jgi:hypothetical protein
VEPNAKEKPSSEKIASNNPEDVLRHGRLEALRKVRHLADQLHSEFREDDVRDDYVFRIIMGIAAAGFALMLLIYVLS